MAGQISQTVEGILGRIRLIAGVSAVPFDRAGEWVRISESGISDYALFQKLRFSWPVIASIDMGKVALVHCKTDPHAGLWLHDLSNAGLSAIYQAGCHEVATWNQSIYVTGSLVSGDAGARY